MAGYSDLGESLVNAFPEPLNLDEDNLRATSILTHWRKTAVKYLSTDPHGHLSQHYNQLAASIPPDFPPRKVINMFLHPVVTADLDALRDTCRCAKLGTINLSELEDFCADYLKWKSDTISQTFDKLQIFQAVALRRVVDQIFATRRIPGHKVRSVSMLA